MDKQVIDFEVNNTCEAYGCFQKATTKINVKVGRLGWIVLDVCSDCVGKFDEDDNGKFFGKSDVKQKLISGEHRQVTTIRSG